MSLPCETVSRRLNLRNPNAPLDANLSAHLGTCAQCRAGLAASEALWRLLGAYESPPLTVDLAPLVTRRLTQRRQATLAERVGAWLAASWPHPRALGAALLVVGIVIGTWAGTTLAEVNAAGTSEAPAATATAESSATIFEASPPGFLNASDPWGGPEAEIP